jgi:hypothetical protein
VSPDPEPIASSAPPALLSDPLLEVVVLHPRDAEAATVGQADRLLALAERWGLAGSVRRVVTALQTAAT